MQMLLQKVQINANKVVAAAAEGINRNFSVKVAKNTGKAAQNETIYVNVFRKLMKIM